MGRAAGIETTVDSFSTGPFYGGVKGSGLHRNRTILSLKWLAPTALDAHVLQSSNSLLSGATLQTRDGHSLTIKAGGILGALPLHVDPADKRLRSNRNLTFDQNLPMAHLRRLTGPGATWIATTPPNGTVWIEVRGIPLGDPGITREALELDPRDCLPRTQLMWAGQDQVVEMAFKSWKWL
jgi:hypothetical protein